MFVAKLPSLYRDGPSGQRRAMMPEDDPRTFADSREGEFTLLHYREDGSLAEARSGCRWITDEDGGPVLAPVEVS